MLERGNSKRVKLQTNNQLEYFRRVLEQTNTIASLASQLGVHRRTVSDWVNARASFPYSISKKIKALFGVDLPSSARLIERYEHTSRAGKKGSAVAIERHGGFPCNEEIRIRSWNKWYKKHGKDKALRSRLPVNEPTHSADLAEMFGIILGDGGIQERQVTITLNSQDDGEYVNVVERKLKKLFQMRVARSYRKDCKAVSLVCSSTRLVEYLEENGLHRGNKIAQQVDIPNWIQTNTHYLKACVRGLIDTDGSIFWETHRTNNRTYSYPRLNFTSASLPLAESVYTFFSELGYEPKRRRSGRSIQIEKKSNICKYYETIGSSNPKNLLKLQRCWEDSIGK